MQYEFHQVLSSIIRSKAWRHFGLKRPSRPLELIRLVSPGHSFKHKPEASLLLMINPHAVNLCSTEGLYLILLYLQRRYSFSLTSSDTIFSADMYLHWINIR